MLISQHPSMKWCRLGYVSGRLAKGQQDRRRVTRENWGMEEQDRLAWDRESAGGWRDPRKGKEGQENGRGSGRLGKRQREGGAAVVGSGRREVKPRVPCFAHDLRCDGESWATTSCPGGWMEGEAERDSVEAMPRRECGLGGPGEKVV